MDTKELAKAIVQGLVPYLVGSRNETKSLGETLKELLAESKKKEHYEVEIDDHLKEELKGENGITPVKGKDYFTDDEIQEIIDKVVSIVTPVAGKDYYTEEEKQSLIEEITASIEVPKPKAGKNGKTPKKGEDYFTEDDIAQISNVIVDMVLEKLPKPKKMTPDEILKALRKMPKETGLQVKDIYGLTKMLEHISLQAGGRRPGSATPQVTGDANFVFPFTALAVVTVPHNLNKYPAVSIRDSAGDECEGDVHYNGLNEVVITFSASFTGMVLCN